MIKNLGKPKKVLIALFIFLFFVICYLLFVFFRDLPSPNRLSSYEIPQTTRIFDRKGNLLYEIYAEQNRTLVHLSDIPVFLRQATISIEGKDFYRHQGVNPVGGILRAAKETILRQKL